MSKCVPLPYEDHEIENPTVQVVHKVDNTIHRTNHYPVDSVIQPRTTGAWP